MPQLIRVRDLVRDETYEFGPDEPILRVPYDLAFPRGAVHRSGFVVDWWDRGQIQSARVAPAALGEAHPGQRVLLNLPPHADDEWWLCDVEAIDGVAGTE